MEIKQSREFFNIMLAKRYPYTIALKRVQIDGITKWLQHLQTKGWWDGIIEKQFISWYNYYNKRYPFTEKDLNEFKTNIKQNNRTKSSQGL